jgi:hypothetical protein
MSSGKDSVINLFERFSNDSGAKFVSQEIDWPLSGKRGVCSIEPSLGLLVAKDAVGKRVNLNESEQVPMGFECFRLGQSAKNDANFIFDFWLKPIQFRQLALPTKVFQLLIDFGERFGTYAFLSTNQ